MTLRFSERGEGRIGCFLTLLVLGLLLAAGVKIVPVYYSNNEMIDTADDLASKAGLLPVAGLVLQLQEKARNLDIPEALEEGAMDVSTSGEKRAGACTIKLKWTRKVDLYGAYLLTIETDKIISKPYVDAR